jgi:ryanodine receptor 2
MPPGLQPAHKMSIILFLERVYGIPDQETFFRLIEDAFLPDIRAATILDSVILNQTIKHFDIIKTFLFNRQRLQKVTWH